MQNILITLTIAGANTDDFSIFTNADGFTTPIATGIAKVDLTSGYTATNVPDGATIIRVQSTNTCTNYVDITITGLTTTSTTTTTTTAAPTTSTTTTTTTEPPTTTSTTTTTTTAVASERIHVSFSNTNSGIVCAGTNKEFVWYNPALVGFNTGATFWTDAALTIPYANASGWTLCGLLTTDGGDGHVFNFGGGNVVGSDTGVIC